jgi:hypothetical protein
MPSPPFNVARASKQTSKLASKSKQASKSPLPASPVSRLLYPILETILFQFSSFYVAPMGRGDKSFQFFPIQLLKDGLKMSLVPCLIVCYLFSVDDNVR